MEDLDLRLGIVASLLFTGGVFALLRREGRHHLRLADENYAAFSREIESLREELGRLENRIRFFEVQDYVNDDDDDVPPEELEATGWEPSTTTR